MLVGADCLLLVQTEIGKQSVFSHQSPVSLQVLQRNTFSEQRAFVCYEVRGEELTSHVSVDKHCRGLELRDGDEAEVMYSLSHYALLAGACVVNWSLSTLSSLSPLTSHCPLTSQETLLLPTTPLPPHLHMTPITITLVLPQIPGLSKCQTCSTDLSLKHRSKSGLVEKVCAWLVGTQN